MTHVVCIVLVDARFSFLVTRRPPDKALGNLWEFPGGKVKNGESAEEALRREIQEELCLSLPKLEPLSPVTHCYDFCVIRLIPFLGSCCTRPEVHLVEHTEARWIQIGQTDELDWAPADIPIVEELKTLFPGKAT